MRRVAAPGLSAAVTTRLLWFGLAAATVYVQLSGGPLFAGIRQTLVNWDAISYLQIAAHGYPATLDVRTEYLDAFLPGFPLLIRGASFVVRDEVLAAFVVTFAGEAIGLWYVYRLVLAERDRGSAVFSVWMIAVLPTAVFFIAPFTEAPFMAAAAAALYHGRQGRFGPAVVAAAAAAALRLTGLALLPALAFEIGRQRGPRRVSGVFLLLIIPLPVVLYCAYMGVHTGDALAFFDAQSTPSFAHSFAPPWDGFASTWSSMVTALNGEDRSIFAREIAFGLLGLVACLAMWASTRVPRSFAIYCSIAWLMTASLSFWRSEPRYFLALFPAVLVVADATARSRAARAVLLTASGALMCAGIWVFAGGRWLG
ncbi:MAG: hypothetical protein JOZ75_10325 [Candidatus Dormibacteraeota bacterium]|nr:hypothetical protein [Candidatus Dormibacteraeota bacterium]